MNIENIEYEYRKYLQYIEYFKYANTLHSSVCMIDLIKILDIETPDRECYYHRT